MNINCGFRLLIIVALALLSVPGSTLAAEDGRMQVFVDAGEDPDTLNRLHADIKSAAQLALPRLWDRIVAQRGRDAVTGNINALQFLQRATPTENGVIITFSKKRVLAYLGASDLPAIEEQPSLHLEVQLHNQSGQSMGQSAAMLQQYAANAAVDWGISLDGYGPSLILQWRWLDHQQVVLVARGTSALGEFSESRSLGSGDPVLQLREWLVELLLRVRDADVPSVTEPVAIVPNELGVPELAGQLPVAEAQGKQLLLTLERRASLVEQVLFEDELRRDPRVVGLQLFRVNRDVQQYRLHLSVAGDRWLVDWFSQRGMQLTPVVEGWVAR